MSVSVTIKSVEQDGLVRMEVSVPVAHPVSVNTWTVKDAEGNDLEFQEIQTVEVEGQSYVLLLPLFDTDEEGAFMIARRDGDRLGKVSDEEHERVRLVLLSNAEAAAERMCEFAATHLSA